MRKQGGELSGMVKSDIVKSGIVKSGMAKSGMEESGMEQAGSGQFFVHPIPPLFDQNCKILILGSFPSVKSREAGFFYGHAQNRFWKVVSAVFQEEVPATISEKKAMLLRNHVALWDVIRSCDIVGSSDASIKNVETNDLRIILDHAPIEAIYVNGRTAFKYYQKYTEPVIKRSAVCLPSTSPANAAWKAERLVEAWKCIRELS